MAKIVSISIECKSCNATGLYSGFAEKDKTAVPCSECNGTGKRIIEGTQFTGKKRTDVNKVFRSSGVVILEQFRGGVSYQKWLNDPESVNRIGNELRDYTCPFMVYQYNAYNVKIVLWEKCDIPNLIGKHISKCPHFSEKHLCWEQFDREMKRNYPDIDNVDDINYDKENSNE